MNRGPKPKGVSILFGYKHIVGLPKCPCNDPGDYMMCEQREPSKPLEVVFRCWCGRTMSCVFKSMAEREEFMKANSHQDDWKGE